jgi:hypothetical protein
LDPDKTPTTQICLSSDLMLVYDRNIRRRLRIDTE